MKAQPKDRTKKAIWLWERGLWLCLFAGLFVAAQAGRAGLRTSFAQDTAKSTQSASVQGPEHQAKQEIQSSVSDERKKRIADESASLLSLANSLKAEVDKTTKDTLSVTVVRKADEIEHLAHKMRAK